MLGEQFERDLLVLSDFLQRTIEDCTDEEIKSIFKLLGQNQQGIGTCSLTSWLKVWVVYRAGPLMVAIIFDLGSPLGTKYDCNDSYYVDQIWLQR